MNEEVEEQMNNCGDSSRVEHLQASINPDDTNGLLAS